MRYILFVVGATVSERNGVTWCYFLDVYIYIKIFVCKFEKFFGLVCVPFGL